MKTRANAKEIALIYNKLTEVGVARDDGTYEYASGWSDERVVAEVAPRLTKGNVNHIRQTHFGMLYKMNKSGKEPSTEVTGLADLKRRVDDLETLVLQQSEAIQSLQQERLRTAIPPVKSVSSVAVSPKALLRA